MMAASPVRGILKSALHCCGGLPVDRASASAAAAAAALEGVAEAREYVELIVADESVRDSVWYGVNAVDESGVDGGGEGEALRGHLKLFS